MKRIRLDLDENSDVNSEIAKLEAKLGAEGLSADHVRSIELEVRASASTLVEQARSIVAAGSQVSAERSVRRENLEVFVRVEAGRKDSLLKRLLKRIGGR